MNPLILLFIIAVIIFIDSAIWLIVFKRSKDPEKVYRRIDANLAVIIVNVSIYALAQIIHIFRG